MFRVFSCLTAEHDYRLVALATGVCLLTSVVAINLFQRAMASQGRGRNFWLGLDAAAAGCGIWATHFIALLAFDAGIPLRHGFGLTALSLVLAIFFTGLGLRVALLTPSKGFDLIGGLIIGAGIAAMHFTGLLALELSGRIDWDLSVVVVSLITGEVLAGLSLVVLRGRTAIWRSTSAALLLMLAVVSHHFIAMAAITVVPDPEMAFEGLSLSPTLLSLMIASVVTIALGMSLVAGLSDRQSQQRLQQQKVLLDTALQNIAQGLAMFDKNGVITLCNEHYAKLNGSSAERLKGRSLLELFNRRKLNGDFLGEPKELFSRIVSDMRAGKSSVRIVETVGGKSIRVIEEAMPTGGWVATFEDITDWREAQTRLSYLAHHDALTGLLNREKFREELDQAISRTKRDGRVAVLYLDLDHFKEINDSLGHPVGDELLKQIAARLQSSIREGDKIARLGGDEFAIIQENRELAAIEVESLANRAIDLIGAPYSIDGHQLNVGASVGIALSPEDGQDSGQLLKNADIALYRAKSDGRGVYRFFEAGMDARAQARRLLEIDLRSALQREELEVFYQSIHNARNTDVLGFEALIRWTHPLRGLVAPGHFIPLAEQTGLIIQIGEFVLRKACADAAGWSRPARVAVNLSPIQFKNSQLVATIISALSDSGLPPQRLELEITESVLLHNSETTLATLHELRKLGIRISMDDFGTGYSSLSYLRSFPFDKIKIDRSFITDLALRADCMAIVRAVTGLAKSLGISTVAEGVETLEQLKLLQVEGCDEVQGFLFNKPRPAVEVELMLSCEPKVA